MTFGCFTNQQNIKRVQLISHIYQKERIIKNNFDSKVREV